MNIVQGGGHARLESIGKNNLAYVEPKVLGEVLEAF